MGHSHDDTLLALRLSLTHADNRYASLFGTLHPSSQNVLEHEMPHPMGRGTVATALAQVNAVVAATLSGLGLLRRRLKQCKAVVRRTE